MLRLAVVAAFMFLGCPSNDVERYAIDGLEVVIEEGQGPEQTAMHLAVEVFRREVQTQFAIAPAGEQSVWEALTEVRWMGQIATDDAYNRDAGKIRLRWRGCVVRGALYRLLTEHYAYVLTQSEIHLGSREWAEGLRAQTARVMCADPKG